ncbi:Phospholipase A2, major isoenzyme [Desmophyllum pertusum]|uniref:Phospholipase A2, major isoenzyme n=1 Tax=Desmophyllum pertusum TaxID=174260 RepID=A0A9W9ZYN8_9CNID|nr:Phospholipase A2, major isoenzyme [Desmophyllum pertusum]
MDVTIRSMRQRALSVHLLQAFYLKPYFIDGCNGCGYDTPSRNDACQLAICECDSAAAKCFAKHEYIENFRNYPQANVNNQDNGLSLQHHVDFHVSQKVN